MQLATGLFPHMVLQRTAAQTSDQPLTGSASADGPVTARVERLAAPGRPLRGLASLTIGDVKRGKLKATLAGVPVGGPYRITLRVTAGKQTLDELVVDDVLVGDVWILAGQSNMQGVGWREYELKPNPMVRNYFMDDRWAVARDSLHNLWDAKAPIHATLCGGKNHLKPNHWSVGPGLSFGQTLHAATGVPQGLIACAHGGTSMSQWDPAKKADGDNSLYGAMWNRVQRNGLRVAGMAWYQGESDSTAVAAPHYTDRMVAFVKALRRDLKAPALPIVTVQIGRLIGVSGLAASWNDIQEQQRRLPERIRHLATIPAIDLTLDDSIHIGGDGQNILGRRLAEAMLTLVKHPKALPPPIELDSIELVPNSRSGAVDIHVRFRNLAGPLVADGMPRGFLLIDANGVNTINRIQLAGDTAILRTGLQTPQYRGRRLVYGHGQDPVCTITDRAGRSLPVFAARHVIDESSFTPFIRSLGVSPVTPAPKPLNRLDHTDLADLPRGSTRVFDTDFCNVNADIEAFGSDPAFVVFTSRFENPTALKANAQIGYDGPVRVFINGALSYTDMTGTNPAYADRASIPFRAVAGTNELVIVLDTNGGKAWGVYLRLQRADRKPLACSTGSDSETALLAPAN